MKMAVALDKCSCQSHARTHACSCSACPRGVMSSSHRVSKATLQHHAAPAEREHSSFHLLASFARLFVLRKTRKVALTQDKVCHANQHAPGSRRQQLQLLASLQSSRTSDAWQSSVHPTQSSACMQCAVASTEQVLVPSHPRSRCVSRRIHGAVA